MLPAQTGSEALLVIEDQNDVRRLVVRTLKKLGCRVFESDSGPNALAVLDSNREIEMLFTDVVMPGGMNGP